MTKKQILGAIAIAVTVLVAGAVYRQLATDDTSTDKSTSGTTRSSEMASGGNASPVPETFDEMAGSITAQAGVDTSALDEEEANELSEIEADSESVTNLGTSYDENNL